MQIKIMPFILLFFYLPDSFCFVSSLEPLKKADLANGAFDVKVPAQFLSEQASQLRLPLLETPAMNEPSLGSEQARLNLIEQLQLLLLADDNSQLAEIAFKYPDLSYRSPISLSELTHQLALFWQIDSEAFRSKDLLEQAALLTAKHPFYHSIRLRILQLNQWQLDMDLNEQKWQWLNLEHTIKLGGSADVLTAIRERLILLGDLDLKEIDSKTTELKTNEDKSPRTDVFDLSLKNAVANFQQRHGLKVDGIIGPNTLMWLNLPLKQRARLLARNFIRQEQWYKSVGSSYLLVNIPQFELSLVHADNQVLQSKVIVGRRGRKTKLIESEIISLVVNPGWNVPYTILRRDLLPRLKEDINYLTDQQYQIFNHEQQPADIDWTDVNKGLEGDFPFRVYQQPGPDNPLGRFKLHFDNPYSIYLHDTPTKKQFALSNRALSSGCVRIEKANEVARWLASSRGINQQLWQQALNNGVKTQWLRLGAPMPIYIVYWTAWMDQQKLPHFRQDIYGWEKHPELLAKNRMKPVNQLTINKPKREKLAAGKLNTASNNYLSLINVSQ